MNAASERELSIFTEAIKKPPQDRSAYLELECRGDENLRRRLEGLLEAHNRVGTFLDIPPPKE
jgi:eukaryotic-like serine/threonine-protein kinase